MLIQMIDWLLKLFCYFFWHVKIDVFGLNSFWLTNV